MHCARASANACSAQNSAAPPRHVLPRVEPPTNAARKIKRSPRQCGAKVEPQRLRAQGRAVPRHAAGAGPLPQQRIIRGPMRGGPPSLTLQRLPHTANKTSPRVWYMDGPCGPGSSLGRCMRLQATSTAMSTTSSTRGAAGPTHVWRPPLREPCRRGGRGGKGAGLLRMLCSCDEGAHCPQRQECKLADKRCRGAQALRRPRWEGLRVHGGRQRRNM